MCGPAIGLIGAVASAAGSIYSGLAAAAGYKAQAQAAKYEAEVQRNQGALESRRQGEMNARLAGKQITATASSGVDLYGTATDVIADSRREGEFDKQLIRWNSSNKAKLKEYEAKVANMNAGSATVGGFIGAVAPLVNGMTGLRNPYGYA